MYEISYVFANIKHFYNECRAANNNNLLLFNNHNNKNSARIHRNPKSKRHSESP